MKTDTPAGFQLLFVDYLMRLPRAEFVGSMIAACSIVLSLAFFSEGVQSLSQALHMLRVRTVPLATLGVLFAIGGWWTVRTWRRLWRCGRSPWERLVYDYGVRMFGVLLSVSQIAIFGYLGLGSSSDQRLLMIGGALAAIFFGTPVVLNLGYLWGQASATIIGIKKDPEIENGDPPLLS